MVEGVAHGVLDDLLCFGCRESVLGLTNEFRFADEDGDHRGSGCHHIVSGDHSALLVGNKFGIGLQPARQREAEARLMRAAFTGRHGVAIGIDEAIVAVPGDGPFDGTVAAFLGR